MPQLCSIDVPAGAELTDLLFEKGVEFPCGGTSVCGGCRVRVVDGEIGVTPDMQAALTPQDLAAGWRLACQAHAHGRVTLEIEQWESLILSDEAQVPFEPRDGFGIAIDLGTTTLVAQLLDLATGDVREVRTALNPQCVHGADVMSRIQFALRNPHALTHSIRQGLAALVHSLDPDRKVGEVLICGNTVMHHLFCGEDVEPLSHVPFESPASDAREFTADELDWHLGPSCRIRFLPCVGSFVGSDILAGMVTLDWTRRDSLIALIDLGTNGEIVIGNRCGALCASTAAGPAFEAGRIRMGMRAAPGAISRVVPKDGEFACHVLGARPARGVCGSGLVDAVAAALQLNRILPTGRLANGANALPLVAPVSVTQSDIRELQLAKAAIAAGVRILLDRWGATPDQLEHVYLAGAFGNYVTAASACRIGLLELAPEKIEPAGNTALRGTKTLLLNLSRRSTLLEQIRGLTQHVSLASDAHFQDVFVDCMGF